MKYKEKKKIVLEISSRIMIYKKQKVQDFCQFVPLNIKNLKITNSSINNMLYINIIYRHSNNYI